MDQDEKLEHNIFTFFVFASFGFILYLQYTTETSSRPLQCFHCTGSICDDPFVPWHGPGVTRVNCSTRCYKARTRDGSTTRGCSASTISTGCSQDDKGTVCACSENLCNSVHHIKASALIIGTVGVLTTLALWTL